MWAEPHNNNPLEKTTLSRQGITAQSKEMKDETAVSPCLDVLAPVASNQVLVSHTCRSHTPYASHILEGPPALLHMQPCEFVQLMLSRLIFEV